MFLLVLVHPCGPGQNQLCVCVHFSGPTVGRIIGHLLFVLRTAIARLNLQRTMFRGVLVCASMTYA